MFFAVWILLIVAGLLASLAVFLWAMRTGQFSDQERARYLPLSDGFPHSKVENPSGLTREVYALLLALGIGILGLAGTVLLTLVKVKG